MKISRGRQSRRAGVVAPDMNVTPLVDVVLVLLIIFMVVAPRLEEDIPVTLPGIFNPDPDVEATSPPLVLTIKSSGEYYVGSSRRDLSTVVQDLSDAHTLDPLRRLELRADAALKYKEIRAIYKRAHQIGFPGVSFLVSQRRAAGSAERLTDGPTQPLRQGQQE